MPFKDLSTTRGKKAKERLSLVVCANATGTHKVPCAIIGKPKSPAYAADSDNGLSNILVRLKHGWMSTHAGNGSIKFFTLK